MRRTSILRTPPRANAEAQTDSVVRDISLLAIPMTAGGDVLFPGGSQMVSLKREDALRVLEAVAGKDPPEFGYLPVNAWGDPTQVGTIAVLDDLQMLGASEKATLLCTGVTRFRVVHLSEDMSSARVELFHDDEPLDKELEDLQRLENKLVEAMTQIVELSIKISDTQDEDKQRALTETLKRVEAFCGNCEEEEGKKLLQHWILDLGPQLRRELLSFIIIDLVSISFMDRRNLMLSTNTANRLAEAVRCLEPYVKELAAKGAIVTALGKNDTDGDQTNS